MFFNSNFSTIDSIQIRMTYNLISRRFSRLQLLTIPLLILFFLSDFVYSNTQRSILVDSAAVACADPLAAKVGLEILKDGGNAIDAVTAVAFTMAVTYPRAGNLGGGGFIISRKNNGELFCLDFRETAPKNATFDLFWDDEEKEKPQRSLIGALAAGVPGTVRGLYFAHQKYGNLPWERVLEVAIKYARNGFTVYEALHSSLKHKKKYFEMFPESMKIYFPNGETIEVGDTLRQLDLANTLEKISMFGDSVFYEGEIAEEIVRSVQHFGGILSTEDFKNYSARVRAPVKFDYRGYTVISMAPPSSGGLILNGILNTLELEDLSSSFEQNSANYIALLSEVEKRWYAHRNLFLADPDFVEIPFELFTSKSTSKDIMNSVSLNTPYPSEHMNEYRQIQINEKSETTHISILDAKGNAVALTYTLNGSFGNCMVAGKTGILLNNEMDDFSVKPGSPNLYGLVQGWANAIEPGKRMLSSMTPTIIEKNGALEGLLGTPGGSTIITSVLQIIINKIDYKMTLQDAMAAGRFHHQWLPDTIYYEKNKFSASVLNELQQRGFRFKPVSSIGDIQAIWRRSNQWEVCSDKDGTGIPKGY
jgi:gamma-glutamyltranspeptidase/glutathione hydrolase